MDGLPIGATLGVPRAAGRGAAPNTRDEVAAWPAQVPRAVCGSRAPHAPIAARRARMWSSACHQQSWRAAQAAVLRRLLHGSSHPAAWRGCTRRGVGVSEGSAPARPELSPGPGNMGSATQVKLHRPPSAEAACRRARCAPAWEPGSGERRQATRSAMFPPPRRGLAVGAPGQRGTCAALHGALRADAAGPDCRTFGLAPRQPGALVASRLRYPAPPGTVPAQNPAMPAPRPPRPSAVR